MPADPFLDPYFDQYRALLISDEVKAAIHAFADLARATGQAGRKMMFAGNGASASIAEHGAADFTKQTRIRGVTFHDPNLMTCFANDFGYDHWVAKAIEHYGDPGDVAVMISTSGASPSVVNAARTARAMGLKVVTFTGRHADNPLRSLGDIAFWAPSHAYNVVENLHAIWLTATIDLVIGRAEYETRALVSG
jgi:D-sedoheptulose 7-phosphate isomerase